MRVDRRTFLSSALAATAFAACGNAAKATRGVPPRNGLPATPRPPAESRVAVVRPEAFGTFRAAVVEAIRLAGGLAFVRPGDRVLLKPAVNSPRRYPATTDPELVAIVARLVLEAGGRPFVADRTMFLKSTKTAFERIGMFDAARSVGIPCLPLDDAPEVAFEHPLAAHWSGRTIRVYRPVAEADHVVNLCTPRTHRLGGFTMAMKNGVGIVAGSARGAMHVGPGFKERLAEISAVFRPSLVVMDGRLGFADGGPDEGDLVRPGFVAASIDPLAIDAIGLAHLRVAGANDAIGRGSIWQIPLMRRAVEIGVGVGSGDRIRIAGLAPEVEARLRRELA